MKNDYQSMDSTEEYVMKKDTFWILPWVHYIDRVA